MRLELICSPWLRVLVNMLHRSHHVDIKRRFVQCFVLRLWRWRLQGGLESRRLGTDRLKTQGMVSANASQHALGMKISWVSFLGTSPFKDLLALHKRLHALQQKKAFVVRVHLTTLFLF